MNRVLTLATFNIRILLGDRAWFVLGWALFALQAVVFGSLMARLVAGTVQDYLFFYGIGLMVITVFDSGASVGRNFVEHAHEGELPYYLSLPISRRGFLAAQALYGVADTMLKTLPPLLGILFFMGRLTVLGAFFAVLALLLLGL